MHLVKYVTTFKNIPRYLVLASDRYHRETGTINSQQILCIMILFVSTFNDAKYHVALNLLHIITNRAP